MRLSLIFAWVLSFFCSSASFLTASQLSLRSDQVAAMKAMRLQSSNHLGAWTTTGSLVTGRASPPSTGRMWSWPAPSARRETNAMRLLSGLQTGEESGPSFQVRRRGGALPSVGTSPRTLLDLFSVSGGGGAGGGGPAAAGG